MESDLKQSLRTIMVWLKWDHLLIEEHLNSFIQKASKHTFADLRERRDEKLLQFDDKDAFALSTGTESTCTLAYKQHGYQLPFSENA
eukprot:gene2295-8048_t